VKRFFVLVASLLAFETASAQRVVYDSFARDGEMEVNRQLCCPGSTSTETFFYAGPTAELHSLVLDATMFYEGHLQVSFSAFDFGVPATPMQSWTARDFSVLTPLFFNSGLQLLSNSLYMIELTVMASTDYQGIESAAIWRENLDRPSYNSISSQHARVTVRVPEPASLWPLSVPFLLLGLARFRSQAGRVNA
jgi:hypothetical protein